MAKAFKLTEIHKVVVYEQLALGKGDKAIASFLKEKFDIVVSHQNFVHYRKHKQKIAAAYDNMKETIREHFPITLMCKRLTDIEEDYEKADRMDEIDPSEFVKRFDNSTEKEKYLQIVQMAATIRGSAEKRIRLRMELRREAKDEVEPLKLEIVDKRTEDATLPRLKNVPTDKIKALMDQYEKAMKG